VNGGREGLIEWGQRWQTQALTQQVMHGAAGREVAGFHELADLQVDVGTDLGLDDMATGP
jgi:hypothetical protein